MTLLAGATIEARGCTINTTNNISSTVIIEGRAEESLLTLTKLLLLHILQVFLKVGTWSEFVQVLCFLVNHYFELLRVTDVSPDGLL